MADESQCGAAQPLIETIRGYAWQPHAAALKHVFLAGDLHRPTPHPYLRRHDVELIWCEYLAGDNGLPHWHAEVDEIEIVLHGRIGYRDIATNLVLWFDAGDVLSIGHGVCVERLVLESAQTIAIKLPSSGEKIFCRECSRTCEQRREEFSPGPA